MIKVVLALGRRPEEVFAGLSWEWEEGVPPPKEERPREGAKRELLHLLRRCRGRRRDTVAGFAEKINRSRSTTRRALRELEEEGEIVVHRQPRGSRYGHLYLLREARLGSSGDGEEEERSPRTRAGSGQ